MSLSLSAVCRGAKRLGRLTACLSGVAMLMGALSLGACGDPTPAPKPSNNTTGPLDMSQPVDMGPRVDQGPGVDMTSPGKPPCPSPLTISPAYAVPFGLLTLQVGGGSGRARFELVENRSGALINEITGAYLAGAASRSTDQVRVEDLECDGQLTLQIQVVEPMRVSPLEVELKPEQGFTFEIAEGSGQVQLRVEQGQSNPTIDASGAYRAGAAQGLDRIVIQDTQTGQQITATVRVSAQAAYAASPGVLYLAPGESFALRARGGSGVVRASVAGDAARVEGDRVIASAQPGQATITLQDAFLPLQDTMTVRVIAPQSFDQRIDGDQYTFNRVIARVDINGDGHLDAVLAHPEASVQAYRSGAVFIYEGSATGLKPTPARVISGQEYAEELGHDVRVADLDGDGAPELIVSSRLADIGAADTGAVFIYRGVPGRFFEDEASQTWSGAFASDQLGYALEVCDVNGDGRLDVLVGVPFGEDRDASPVRSDQGALHVFLNYPSGWLPKADQQLYGKMFDEQGAWSGLANMRIAQALAAADFDGDGRCDVFVASPTHDNGRGAVLIYRGKGPDALGPGGLQEEPSAIISLRAAGPSNAQLGRRIAAGDLDGDGLAELIMGAYLWEEDNSVVALRDRGAVFALAGQALPSGPVTAYWDEAKLTLLGQGDQGGDHYGWHVEAHDVDGDNLADVLINGRLDELPAGPVSAGTVFIHYGRRGQPLKPEPDVTLSGPTASDLFGQAFWAGGDLDGDGSPDLVVYSPRADRQGLDAGDLYWIPLNSPTTLNPLDMTLRPSGAQMGRAVRFVGDLNGDGLPELAVGAIRQSPAAPSAQLDAGLLHLYASGPSGYGALPTQTLSDFFTHSVTDFFGRSVDQAADFDGDVRPDLAVVAELEDRPTNYSASTYDNSAGCPNGARTDSGALYIFRGSAQADRLVEPEPAFILHGPESSDRIIQVVGGLDVNGDGIKDLIYASQLWDDATDGEVVNRGGFGILLGGKAATPGKVKVLCGPDFAFYGDRASAALGYALTSMGDLDGDGCDDFAVGARTHGQGQGGQGQVRVYFGFGAACAHAQPKMIALAPGLANSRVGTSLAGGQDVDGDQIPDLVVGADGYRVGSDTVGAAWLLPGSYLRGLPKEDACHEGQLGSAYSCPVCPAGQVSAGTCNPREARSLRPMTPTGSSSPLLVAGTTPGQLMGTSVALVPDSAGQGRALIAVGSPQAAFAGVGGAGGASLYRVTGQGAQRALDPAPVAIFGGEPSWAGSLLGEELHAARVGQQAMCVVAGTRSRAVGLDQGAAFVLPVPIP